MDNKLTNNVGKITLDAWCAPAFCNIPMTVVGKICKDVADKMNNMTMGVLALV